MDNENINESVEELPICHYTGKITVIEKPDFINNIVSILLEYNVLGFDTETKPSFTKGEKHKIALLQICSPDGAYLFRINKTGFHPALVNLLENETVLKIGVATHEDLRGLGKLKQFTPRGFIDLQKFASKYGINVLSLKGLAAEVLHKRISKKQQVTNWEAARLSQSQIVYAATDAWIALCIYNELINRDVLP